MTTAPTEIIPGHQRSFGEAVAALPGQYVKVLTRPSVKTFVAEKTGGRWGVVWLQLLLLGLVSALLALLAYAIVPPTVSAAQVGSVSVQDVQRIVEVATAILTFILTPITFLLSGVVFYLLAHLFGGKGSYLEQISATLLFGVPLVLLSSLLFLLPATRDWLPWVPHLYSAVLFVLMLIAVHGRGERN